MKQEKTDLGEVLLVGITARTNNKAEMNPETAKIGQTFEKYLGKQLPANIKHRLTPGVTYSVYTDFESDEHGEYTYFLGEAVDSFDGQDLETFETLTVPASAYQKFTTESGPIPRIVIDAWQAIWKMTPDDFGSARRYIADFEVYDQRAADSVKAVVDIYIGVDS